MFKVLDLAISDRNSIYLIIYLFIYIFIYFSERMGTKKKVYFDLSSGHLTTASSG